MRLTWELCLSCWDRDWPHGLGLLLLTWVASRPGLTQPRVEGVAQSLRQPAVSVPSSHSLVATKESPGSQQLCKVHWGRLLRAAGPFQSQIRGKEGQERGKRRREREGRGEKWMIGGGQGWGGRKV